MKRHTPTASNLDPSELTRRLAAAGVDGTPAWTAALSFGKTAIGLRDGAGFVKLALGPFATALVRREATAYAAPGPQAPFTRPDLLGFHDGGDWAALWISQADGRPEPSWKALAPRGGPFEGERPPTVHPLSTVLDVIAPESDRLSVFSPWRRALIARDGDRPVACGRAHGDFIYWNVLRRRGAAPALIDFEHALDIAPLGHDRLYWTLVPLLRRAAALGHDTAVAMTARMLTPMISPPHLMTAFLLRLGMRLERERAETHRTGGAAGPEVARRTRLLALLEHLVGEISPK